MRQKEKETSLCKRLLSFPLASGSSLANQNPPCVKEVSPGKLRLAASVHVFLLARVIFK